MFTGLVEAIGEVVAVTRRTGSSRIEIASPFPSEGAVVGDSVAVDGACLTVVRSARGSLSFDVVAETMQRTTLGTARPGQRVHLERAMVLGERLGGHLVQGHVDAVLRVSRVSARGDDWRLRLSLVDGIRPYVASKGSVAIQGVSLTVAAVDRAAFEVALIPETLRRTTLGEARAGTRLNVEVDLVARYLEVLARYRGSATR